MFGFLKIQFDLTDMFRQKLHSDLFCGNDAEDANSNTNNF